MCQSWVMKKKNILTAVLTAISALTLLPMFLDLCWLPARRSAASAFTCHFLVTNGTWSLKPLIGCSGYVPTAKQEANKDQWSVSTGIAVCMYYYLFYYPTIALFFFFTGKPFYLSSPPIKSNITYLSFSCTHLQHWYTAHKHNITRLQTNTAI